MKIHILKEQHKRYKTSWCGIKAGNTPYGDIPILDVFDIEEYRKCQKCSLLWQKYVELLDL